jgi:hypothetical protein
MLAFACMLGFFGISMLRRNYRLSTKGVATSGTVIDFEERMGSRSGRSYYPKVEFQIPSGEKVEFIASVGSSATPKLGRKVKVLYFSDKPQDAEVASLLRFWVFPLLVLGAGAVFLLGSLVFYTAAFGDAA